MVSFVNYVTKGYFNNIKFGEAFDTKEALEFALKISPNGEGRRGLIIELGFRLG